MKKLTLPNGDRFWTADGRLFIERKRLDGIFQLDNHEATTLERTLAEELERRDATMTTRRKLSVAELEGYKLQLRELCDTILAAKNAEYAANNDRLSGFRELADELRLDPYTIIWIFLKKQLSAILYTINGLADAYDVDSGVATDSLATSEPIERRIADAINFLTLLYANLRHDGIIDLPEEEGR